MLGLPSERARRGPRARPCAAGVRGAPRRLRDLGQEPAVRRSAPPRDRAGPGSRPSCSCWTSRRRDEPAGAERADRPDPTPAGRAWADGVLDRAPHGVGDGDLGLGDGPGPRVKIAEARRPTSRNLQVIEAYLGRAATEGDGVRRWRRCTSTTSTPSTATFTRAGHQHRGAGRRDRDADRRERCRQEHDAPHDLGILTPREGEVGLTASGSTRCRPTRSWSAGSARCPRVGESSRG